MIKNIYILPSRILLSIITISILLTTVNACKDATAIDPNFLKRELDGDTVRIDTSYINYKKVIIREIVKNNVTILDTLYVDKEYPVSSGSMNNFLIQAIYSTPNSPFKDTVKVSNLIFLINFNSKFEMNYNNYLPKISFNLSCSIMNDSLEIPREIDTLNKIQFLFYDLDFFYLVNDTPYDLTPYLLSGAKANIWLNSRMSEPLLFDGSNNSFHLQALNTIETGGKISKTTIVITALLDNIFTKGKTSIFCSFDVIFN